MREDIQKDIDKINYIYNMNNKSVFICINCINFEMKSYSEFYSQEENIQNEDYWFWVKFVKNDKRKIYISTIFPNNKESKMEKGSQEIKSYLKYLLYTFKYNLKTN